MVSLARSFVSMMVTRSYNTSPVLINPLENADHDQESNAVLLKGAAGPIRIGAETLESVPYVMHNSDNDDEENDTKNPRPSNTVPAYLLGTTKVAKANDGFYPVVPDLVSVEKTNIPKKYKVRDAGRHHLLPRTPC